MSRCIWNFLCTKYRLLKSHTDIQLRQGSNIGAIILHSMCFRFVCRFSSVLLLNDSPQKLQLFFLWIFICLVKAFNNIDGRARVADRQRWLHHTCLHCLPIISSQYCKEPLQTINLNTQQILCVCGTRCFIWYLRFSVGDGQYTERYNVWWFALPSMLLVMA